MQHIIQVLKKAKDKRLIYVSLYTADYDIVNYGDQQGLYFGPLLFKV